MTSDDFANIFYSNYTPNIDWANIDEINWMYKEELFTISSKIIGSSNEFMKKIDFVLNPKNNLIKSGESDQHLALKSFAVEYLTSDYGILKEEVKFEYPLIGFEVDVIDKDLWYPTECGDTNALKLEKYLGLPNTKRMLILPYPNANNVKIFEFQANPKFFKYIKHKQTFLNQKNAKFRK